MPAKRSYVTLTEADWADAAEKNARGMSYDALAKEYGVSPRTVATHIPPALERRRKAIAASSGGSAATAPVSAIVLAALPDVADRELATKHWRQSAWADAQMLQTQLRGLTASPAPDTKAIRAVSAAAMALKDLVRLQADILDVERHAADEIIPELVIRELTDAEVAAIRQSQRETAAGFGDLDDADRLALNLDDDDGDAEERAVVVEGCDEVSGA